MEVELEKTDPNLVVQAAWNKERDKLTLVILNFNTTPQDLRIDHSKLGRKLKARKGCKISPESGWSFNSLENPENIKIEPFNTKAHRMAIDGMSLLTVELFE